MDRKQGTGFMREIFGETRFLVVTGNYGSGKTEISLNLALKASDEGKTTLVDLDIVNPYLMLSIHWHPCADAHLCHDYG